MTTEAIQRMSPEQQLEQMRHRGLDRTHPVRFRYLQALERRLRERGLEQSEHWRRLEQKLREFQDVCSDVGSPDAPPLAPPKPLSALAELSKALDSQGPPPVPQPSSPLFELLKQNSAEATGTDQADQPQPSGAPQPLRAMAQAKARQGERSLEQRIQAAIEQTPANAGPMNAHRLVSRAIKEMQRLSPDYLKRFAAYTDALLAMEKLNPKG